MSYTSPEDSSFEQTGMLLTKEHQIAKEVQMKFFEQGFDIQSIPHVTAIEDTVKKIQSMNEHLSDQELTEMVMKEIQREKEKHTHMHTVKQTLRSRFTNWVKDRYQKVREKAKNTIKRPYEWLFGPRKYMKKIHNICNDFSKMTERLIVGFEKWIVKMEKYNQEHPEKGIKQQHLLEEIKAQRQILDALKSSMNSPAENLEEMDARMSQIIQDLEDNAVDPSVTNEETITFEETKRRSNEDVANLETLIDDRLREKIVNEDNTETVMTHVSDRQPEPVQEETIKMTPEEKEDVSKDSEKFKPLSDSKLPETRKIEMYDQPFGRSWKDRIGIGVLFEIEEAIGAGGMGKTIKLKNIANAEDNPYFDKEHPRFTDVNHPHFIGKRTLVSPDGSQKDMCHEVTEAEIEQTIKRERALLQNLKRPSLDGPPGSFDIVPEDEPIVLKMLNVYSKSNMNRLFQEGKVMKSLNHENIAQLFHITWEYDVDMDEFHFMHLMEYIDGNTLDKHVRDIESNDDFIDIASQICDGLTHAHENGVIHRDIKPDNIMVTKDGHVKIIDFGVSKQQKLKQSELDEFRKLGIIFPEESEGNIVGTIRYMPPEQVKGEIDKTGPTADIYALGATLYHLLTGKPVVEGNKLFALAHQIMTKNPPTPKEINPEISSEMSDLIMQMLAKDPTERPKSMREVKEKLQAMKTQPVEKMAA